VMRLPGHGWPEVARAHLGPKTWTHTLAIGDCLRLIQMIVQFCGADITEAA